LHNVFLDFKLAQWEIADNSVSFPFSNIAKGKKWMVANALEDDNWIADTMHNMPAPLSC
jgi:hypothetical protein